MNLLTPTSIEEQVISSLVNGKKPTKDLLLEIKRERKSVTKQGFYKALRALRQDEVIVNYKKTVSLNTTWIWEMQSLFNTMNRAYTGSGDPFDILALAEQESVSYSFQTTHQLDVFWGHSQNILIRSTPVSEPVYASDPHYWFYIARKETESKLLAQITATGRQFLMTVAGNTDLDRAIHQDFSTGEMQYHVSLKEGKNTYYVVVIGDYITEVHLDPLLAKKIDRIYENNQYISHKVVSALQELLQIRGKNRLKITKNAKKARVLKAHLGKNFFIQKPDK